MDVWTSMQIYRVIAVHAEKPMKHARLQHLCESPCECRATESVTRSSASRMPARRPRQMNGTRLKDFLATLAFGHQRPGFFAAEGGSRSVDAHDRGQQHDDDVRLFHRHAALHDVTARANFTGSRRAAGPSRSGIYIRQGGCPVERRDRPDTGVPACRYRRPRTPARRRRCWSGVATDTTTRWHADHCSSFSTSSS